MQGNCATPFQGGSDGPPVGDLAPRQCVLSVTARLVNLADHTPGLWLDNLALRFTGTSSFFGFLAWSASLEASPGALWLTGVTVAGGIVASGASIDGTALFASGALLSCARAVCGASRRAVSRPRAAVRCVSHTAVAGAPCKEIAY